jgi:hypothetical protein
LTATSDLKSKAKRPGAFFRPVSTSSAGIEQPVAPHSSNRNLLDLRNCRRKHSDISRQIAEKNSGGPAFLKGLHLVIARFPDPFESMNQTTSK